MHSLSWDCFNSTKHTSSSGNLDVRWVQHNSDGSTKGLWWQVLFEGSSHSTIVTVSSSDLTPDDSDLRTSDFLGSTVDVGYTLTQVEFSLIRRTNTLNLKQRDAWVVSALGTLVRQVLALNIYCDC